jgi:hypothetical protein
MRDELLENGSGCIDPTAFEAIIKVDREIEARNKARVYKFHRLLDMIRDMCDMCDFELEEHIILKDRVTGKVWR